MAVAETLKNATYVTIGFGVLGFQKAQVRRHELTKQLAGQIAEGRKTVSSLAAQLDGYVVPVRAQVETGLDSFEAVLPPPVQDLVGQARAALSEQERTLRARLGLPAIATAA